MHRRATMLLVVPAALLGWAVLALLAWLLWTHPVPVVVGCLLLTGLTLHRRPRTPEPDPLLRPRDVPGRPAPQHRPSVS